MNFKLYSALCAAGMLALTACTSDDALLQGNGDGTVTFNIQLPAAMKTRAAEAFGNGKTATRLNYYVYDAVSGDLITKSADETINISKQVTLNLVNGAEYQIVWFAQSQTANYVYDEENKTVEFDFDGLAQNLEDRDAFYACTNLKVTGASEQTVELYRPFAQVNFGTSEILDASETADYQILENAFGEDLAGLQTSLTVTSKVPNVLNLADGTVSGEEELTFALTERPEGQNFPIVEAGKTYSYLAMDYILAPKDGAICDLTFSIYSGNKKFHDIVVASAPVRANYRTNIFGQLLTSTNKFNVVIVPDFAEPDNNLPVYVVAPENVMNTEFESDKSYVISGTAENPATITVDAAKTIEAASITFENVVIDASFPMTIKNADVAFSGVEITGVKDPAASSNPSIVIEEAENISISDVTFNREGSYNGFEIGLRSTENFPKEIVVENLDWSNAKHNAICVYGMEDNTVITVRNCKFDNTQGGVPVRLANKTYAKNVTVNLENVERLSSTASAGRCDDVLVWIQDANTYSLAKKDGKLDAGNLFEELNPFGTFTINLSNVKVDGQAITAATPVFTDAFTGNTAKIAGVAVNNVGSKTVDNTTWVVNQHVVTPANGMNIEGWGMDLIKAAFLLPTVVVK